MSEMGRTSGVVIPLQKASSQIRTGKNNAHVGFVFVVFFPSVIIKDVEAL